MADPTLTKKFALYIGDGADPEVFSWICGVNTRDMSLTNNTSAHTVMDCDNPLTVVPTTVRQTTAQDTNANVSGRVALTSVATLREWADTGAVKNIQLVLDETGANGGGTYDLPAILESFQVAQEDADHATFTATIVGAGRRVWTAAA